MLLFIFYCILFLLVVYWYKLSYRNFVSIVFIAKALFIFLVSYTNIKNYSFLNVPDEDNYFHDIVLFHQLAIHHPLLYFQFLFDIEPSNIQVFGEYFSHTNAWYKAPEFFYNDNRWVIKIHSILSFVSGCNLSVHRLFSAVFSIIGWIMVLNFSKKILLPDVLISEKTMGWIFFISCFFPAFFFFNHFVLKESILILLMGLILQVLYLLISESKWNVWNILSGIILIVIAFFFRPTYLLPLIFFTALFLFVNKHFKRYKTIIFSAMIVLFVLIVWFAFSLLVHRSFLEIIQYRQERFLDASKGGIFLLNTKKFVRAPYCWECLKSDSLQKIPTYTIKKNVPLMYWYLTNLNDTIAELNKDTSSEYHILYYIEKANRTVYIQTIKVNQNFWYNLKSVVYALQVFFFYPKNIQSITDLIVWLENIALIIMLVILAFNFKKQPLYILYILMFISYVIVMIALSSPNTGAIFRYRYFILPYIFINIALIYYSKYIQHRLL